MESLKKKFAEKALALFTELRAINKEHGETKLDEVALRQSADPLLLEDASLLRAVQELDAETSEAFSKFTAD